MRLPRPRLTIRRLMVVVGRVALLLAFVPHWFYYRDKLHKVGFEQFDREFDVQMHQTNIAAFEDMLAFLRKDSRRASPNQLEEWRAKITTEHQLLQRVQRQVSHWSALRDKYARAALQPWVALPPDPPEPE